VAALVDLAIALLIMLVLMGYYEIGLHWTSLFAILVLAITTLLVVAICLFVSSVQVRLRDISVSLPLLLQILTFTTPIVYPASLVPANLRVFYWLNPFAILIDSFRQAFLHGLVPNGWAMLYCAVVAGLFFIVSYWFFKKVEATMVDDM
jgi:lipopolysaccharide transport system permease protein